MIPWKSSFNFDERERMYTFLLSMKELVQYYYIKEKEI